MCGLARPRLCHRRGKTPHGCLRAFKRSDGAPEAGIENAWMHDHARLEQRRARLARVIQDVVTTCLARPPEDSRSFEGVRTVELVNSVIGRYVADRPPETPRVEDVEFVREAVCAACVAVHGAVVCPKGVEVLPTEEAGEDGDGVSPSRRPLPSGCPHPTECGCGEPRRFLYDETVLGVRWICRRDRSTPSLPHVTCTSFGGWCQDHSTRNQDHMYVWEGGRCRWL